MTILQNKYATSHDFHYLNFKELARKLVMEIYIISAENIFTYSNVKADIGLDFTECCTSLVKVLNERRDSGNLYIDVIDIVQHNAGIKKYSYLVTVDKKYIFKLGYIIDVDFIF